MSAESKRDLVQAIHVFVSQDPEGNEVAFSIYSPEVRAHLLAITTDRCRHFDLVVSTMRLAVEKGHIGRLDHLRFTGRVPAPEVFDDSPLPELILPHRLNHVVAILIASSNGEQLPALLIPMAGLDVEGRPRDGLILHPTAGGDVRRVRGLWGLLRQEQEMQRFEPLAVRFTNRELVEVISG